MGHRPAGASGGREIGTGLARRFRLDTGERCIATGYRRPLALAEGFRRVDANRKLHQDEAGFGFVSGRATGDRTVPIRVYRRRGGLLSPVATGHVPDQHSGTFTTRPPGLVSLNLALIFRPVSRIALMQLSSGITWAPSPLSASDATVATA